MPDPRERLIVALDVSSAAAARKIVAAVGDSAHAYKVGMQLYTAEGPSIVRELVGSGRRVFLDLKYHDIPNTVAAAVREAAQSSFSFRSLVDFRHTFVGHERVFVIFQPVELLLAIAQ